MAKSSKDSNPSPALEDWIESASTFSQGPAWKSIPKKALEDIDRVLAHNDTCPARAVPQTALLKRIREVYKVKLTRGGLNHYLQTVLGRHWRKD